MARIVQLIGILMIVAAFTIALFALLSGSFETAIHTAFVYALPTFVAGVLLVCFGEMTDHLEAIRNATERQARAFTKIADRAPSAKTPPAA